MYRGVVEAAVVKKGFGRSHRFPLTALIRPRTVPEKALTERLAPTREARCEDLPA